MAVEIRQLTIKCDVQAGQGAASARALAQVTNILRRDILAECERRIERALREAGRER